MRKLLAVGLFALALIAAVFACNTLSTPPAVPSQPITSAVQSQPQPSSASGVGEPNGASTLLQIQPHSSTATFTVDEILRGSPNTVVGKTDQVAGEIDLDPNDPSATKVGTVLVDARGLTTDDSQRNNMLHRFILSTTQFEYVSFTPTNLTGLPVTVTPGAAYPVQIDGKLTIRDVTRDVTFNANITPLSMNELKGSATTTISQKDFGITIPQIPFVAGVSDNVKLDLNFVATAA